MFGNPPNLGSVLAIASIASVLLGGCGGAAVSEPTLPAVFVSSVRNDTGSVSRIMSGTLRPRVETELAFRTGGKVVARYVDVGQIVRTGQALARLDPSDLNLGVDTAVEQLRVAEVDAVQTASDAARFKRLLVDGSVGAADLERLQARADAAAARRAQAERQLELQRNRASYTVLTAPFGGVVTALRFETGQTVSEGQGVLSLAKPGELEAVVDLPETMVADIREYSASLEFAGLGTSQRLKLRELAPVAAAQTRTFRARYALSSPANELKIGSSVEVRLTRPGARSSSEIPASALIRASGLPSVWLADEKTGELKRQPVEVLSQTTNRIRVAGLADGVLVVSVGAQKLDEGMAVRVLRRPLDAPALSVDAASTGVSASEGGRQ